MSLPCLVTDRDIAFDAESRDFARDKDGRILTGALESIRLALSKLGMTPTFDQLSREIRIDGRPLDDVAVDLQWVQLQDEFKFRPSKELLQTLMLTEAHRATVHPVRDYVDALVWDGSPRLNIWLMVYAGAASTPYTRAVARLPLIAAVRRVRKPGTANSCLPTALLFRPDDYGLRDALSDPLRSARVD